MFFKTKPVSFKNNSSPLFTFCLHIYCVENLFTLIKTRFYGLLTLVMLAMLLHGPVKAQVVVCDAVTPVFNVNLSGQPNGTWVSPSIVRDGYCCSANGNEVCIRFDLLLDSAANGINFGIASGAMPSGALYYQINCGPMLPVGTPICLNGPGPHVITFCKPGNNTNSYQITSLPKPSVGQTQLTTQNCTSMIGTTGLDESTVQWTSIPPNALYNSFLSCMSGCDTVTVTPSANPPPFIDYQVTGSAANGCLPGFFVDTVRVYMEDALAVQIAPQNFVICYGNPSPTLTATPTGGRPSYTYLWSTGETTASIVAGPGNYTVSVVDSMNCTTVACSTSVIGFSAPITSIAGNDTIVCSGLAPIQLNGTVTGTSTGQWLGGNGTFTPNRQTLNASYTPTAGELATGMIQLILSNTNTLGCPTDYDTIAIRLLDMPNPVLNGPATVCETETSVYWLTASGPYTPSWSVTGGTIINNAGNAITVLWNTSGGGTVTVTESNQNLCVQSASMNIVIQPKPNPVIFAGSSVCAWSQSTASVLTPQPNTTYTWTVTGGTINGNNTGSNISINWQNYGTGSIYVSAVNSQGCIKDTSITVTILANPQITMAGSSSSCQSQTGIYQATYISGAQYAWTVTGGTAPSYTGNSLSVTWNQPGPGSVTLQVTNPNGCDTTLSMNVTVNQKALPVISGLNNSCIKVPQTYVALNAQPGSTYLWNVTGGTIQGSPNNDTIIVNWNNIGNSTVSLKQTTAGGCDSTAYLTVAIAPVPIPQLYGDPSVCQFEVVSYRAPQLPGYNYRVNIVNGQMVSHTNDTLTVNWIQDGTGTIQYTVEYPDGCDSTINFTVQVGRKPNPQISGPSTLCEGQSGSYLTSSLTGSFLYWNISNGVPFIAGNGTNATVVFTIAGTAQIQLTEITSLSCSTTIQMPVQVLARPHPVLSGSPTGCLGAAAYRYSTGVTNGLHQWSVTGGNYQLIGNDIDVYWSTPGQHTVSVSVLNPATGCDSTVSMIVNVDSLATPVISTGSMTACAPIEIQFTGNQILQGYSFSWDFGNGTNSFAANPLMVYNDPGTYNITLIATNATGCADTAYSTLQIFPAPVSSFTATVNTSINLYDPNYFTLQNLSTNAISYLWDFGNGDTSWFFEPYYTYPTYGNYPITLIVENNYGCKDTSVQYVEIKLPELLHIPNAFTPNHDGKNDNWFVKGENITDLTVTIFNRWGQPIYKADNPYFEWDGTYAGKNVEGGVYVYQLKAHGLHGKSFEKTGTLTLVR